MKKVFAFFRNTIFLAGLCLLFLTTTIGAITWGIQTAATLTAATSTAVAKAVMKTKAKARIRRALVAIPLAGVGAGMYFEERDYRDWKDEHPEGTRKQYGCEVLALTAEVLEDVLQDLPEYVRPEADAVLSRMPVCELDPEVPV